MKKQLIGLALLTTISSSIFAATFTLDRLIADPAILGKIISKDKIVKSLKSGKSINITTRGKLIVYSDGRIKGTGSGGAIFNAKKDVLQINGATFCNSHVCKGFKTIAQPTQSYKDAAPHANAQISAVAADAISASAISTN